MQAYPLHPGHSRTDGELRSRILNTTFLILPIGGLHGPAFHTKYAILRSTAVRHQGFSLSIVHTPAVAPRKTFPLAASLGSTDYYLIKLNLSVCVLTVHLLSVKPLFPHRIQDGKARATQWLGVSSAAVKRGADADVRRKSSGGTRCRARPSPGLKTPERSPIPLQLWSRKSTSAKVVNQREKTVSATETKKDMSWNRHRCRCR